jgi:hypothetical protein
VRESPVETGCMPFGCLNSVIGILTIILVQVLFIYQYCVTVLFGVWMFDFTDFSRSQDLDQTAAIINTVVFSLFWALMVWSHLVATSTKPGYIAPDHKQLSELAAFPNNSQLFKILRIREWIYAENLVRRKIRKGQLLSFKEHVAQSLN